MMLRPGPLTNVFVTVPAALWSGALVVLGLIATTPRRPAWISSLIELHDRQWLALGLSMICLGLFCFLTGTADRWFASLRDHALVWTAEMCLLCGAFLGLLGVIAR